MQWQIKLETLLYVSKNRGNYNQSQTWCKKRIVALSSSNESNVAFRLGVSHQHNLRRHFVCQVLLSVSLYWLGNVVLLSYASQVNFKSKIRQISLTDCFKRHTEARADSLCRNTLCHVSIDANDFVFSSHIRIGPLNLRGEVTKNSMLPSFLCTYRCSDWKIDRNNASKAAAEHSRSIQSVPLECREQFLS